MRPEKLAAHVLGQVGHALAPEAFRGRRFSVEHLVHVHAQLARNRTVSARNQTAITEQLRSLAEIVVHGDVHDPLVFEAFLEHSMLDTLMSFMRAPRTSAGHAVVVQALQSLSIVTQNVRTQSSIYFLLSNSSIDSLCRQSAHFEQDEELLCNYITLLKALALNLTNTTIQFFLADESAFPLYTEAVRFSTASDPMVVSAVRTIALSVYRLTDERARRLVLAISPRAYWRRLASEHEQHASALCASLVGAYTASAGIDGRPPSAATAMLRSARRSLEDLLDGLYYVNDVMTACVGAPLAGPAHAPAVAPADTESYASALTRVLLQQWLLPRVLAPLARARAPAAAPHDGRALAAMLLVLVHALIVVESRVFSSTLALLLLAPSVSRAARSAPIVAELGARPPTLLIPAELAGEVGNARRAALLALVSRGDEPTGFGAVVLLCALIRAAGGEDAGQAPYGETVRDGGDGTGAGDARVPAEREGEAGVRAPAGPLPPLAGTRAADGAGVAGASVSAPLLKLVGLMPYAHASAHSPSAAASPPGAPRDGEPPAGATAHGAAARMGSSAGAGGGGELGADDEPSHGIIGALLELLERGFDCERAPRNMSAPAGQHTLAGASAARALHTDAQPCVESMCAAAELVALLCKRPRGCAADGADGAQDGAHPAPLLAEHARALARLLSAARELGRAAHGANVTAAAQGAHVTNASDAAEIAFDAALARAWRSAPRPLVCARGIGSATGGPNALEAAARNLPLWAGLPAEAGADRLPAGGAGGAPDAASDAAALRDRQFCVVLVGTFLRSALGEGTRAESGVLARAADVAGVRARDGGGDDDAEAAMLLRVRAFLGLARAGPPGREAQQSHACGAASECATLPERR